ncbi:hypothetical protein [Rhizocola hellebori]|nr:hypothetical protein [Rhizocola hellebori]
MRRWHRPHSVTGFQLFSIVATVIMSLVAVALITAMALERIESSGFLVVLCLAFLASPLVGRSYYSRGVYVGEKGIRMRGIEGKRTVRWAEIAQIKSGRSKVADETDPAIWVILKDGERIEAPLKGSHVLPTLGMMRTEAGFKVTERPSLVLPMNEFHGALNILRECLAKSRQGQLQIE